MASHIELRKVKIFTTDPNGGPVTEQESWEYRTKDILISVLGISLGSWTDWMRIETITVNQNGVPI